MAGYGLSRRIPVAHFGFDALEAVQIWKEKGTYVDLDTYLQLVSTYLKKTRPLHGLKEIVKPKLTAMKWVFYVYESSASYYSEH